MAVSLNYNPCRLAAGPVAEQSGSRAIAVGLLLCCQGWLRGAAQPGASGWPAQGGWQPGCSTCHQSNPRRRLDPVGFVCAPNEPSICSACWWAVSWRWPADGLPCSGPVRTEELVGRSFRPTAAPALAQPGVGNKRTAERLCLFELRSKRRGPSGAGSPAALEATRLLEQPAQRQRPGPSHPRRRQITLAALGYEPRLKSPGAAGRGPARGWSQHWGEPWLKESLVLVWRAAAP